MFRRLLDLYLRRGAIALAVLAASAVAIAWAPVEASAESVDGCTHNFSYLTEGHMHIAGLMTGCPRGHLYIWSEYYYNGVLVPVHENDCENSTGCSVATTDYYECFAPGEYTLRIKGKHGGATDYADVYVVLPDAVAQANPACSAAQLSEFSHESSTEVAAQLAAGK